MNRILEKVKLLNTYVNNVKMDEAINEIDRQLNSNRKSYLVAVNVDVIMKIEKDSYLKEISDKADMVFVDGMPLLWISKLHKQPIKEKISGSDLVPQICSLCAKKGYTIYILGGKDGIANQAKKNLELNYPGIKVVGTYSPPLGFENNQDELSRINSLINEASPDFLLACLGCPKQEKFIYENIGEYNAKVSVCAGATVDFLAGNINRAPSWMSKNGLEWLYRFAQEPKRLFKRYFIDDIQIVKLILKYWR